MSLGFMIRREIFPENLPDVAQRIEQAGFDEVWVVEDCFYGSGIASATAALASTEKIKVGLGIMPAVARNPAFTAMEIATLGRIYPERFLPGIGHGVGAWMQQIGAFPASQLVALEETVQVVRLLLRGETVSFMGKHVQLNDVTLEFAPNPVPPVSLGVRGPKSLAISGRVADGTILAEGSSPAYIKWARTQINADTPHRVTVYVLCDFGDNAHQNARRILAGIMAEERTHVHFEPMGIVPEIKRLVEAGTLQKDMPDTWVEELAVLPETGQATIERLRAAGADSVVLVPIEDDLATITEAIALF